MQNAGLHSFRPQPLGELLTHSSGAVLATSAADGDGGLQLALALIAGAYGGDQRLQ